MAHRKDIALGFWGMVGAVKKIKLDRRLLLI